MAANPSAESLGGNPTLNEADKLSLQMRALFGESKGYMSELSRLDDPERVKDAIDEVSASAVGLPAVNIFGEVVEYKIKNGDIVPEISTIQMVSGPELMKIFIDPDFAAGQKDAGYQANVSLNMAINSTSRDEVQKGLKGPGIFGVDEAVHYVDQLVKSGKLDKNNREKAIGMIAGSVKPKAQEVVRVLVEAAPVVKARAEFWRAYGEYAQTGGDEKSGSALFTSPGHGSPTGPDFQAFFPKGDVEMDGAMRQIYAIGIPYDELVKQGKTDLAVEGIHYRENQKGEREVIKGNVYVDGFNSENFAAWMSSILKMTNGNLLKAYDAWYSSMAMGLVAKVAFDGVKVGDPPWVSSADAWMQHFGKKQKAEAGLNAAGKREKLASYTSKTGPVVGVDKYPESWIGCFFDNATLGKSGKTIFQEWWDGNRNLGDIPWLVLGQEVGGTEEEVKLNGFDGFLYKKMQLFKLLDTIQNVPALGDICKYTFWQGTARTLDKAMGTVYDLDTPANRAKAAANGVVNATSEIIRKDNVDFIKVVPDEKNARIVLFKGLLSRYSIDWKNDSIKGVDTPVAIGERFTHLSEKQIKEMVVAPGAKKPEMIGVPIELFIKSVVGSGMLTVDQSFNAIIEMYGRDKFDAIYINSDWIKLTYQRKWEEYKKTHK